MDIEELIENFALFEDWEDRYRYLIDLGQTLLLPMAEELKTETSKVKGCMSQVWMVLGWDDTGKLTFTADSDAQIVKGLIAVLKVIYAGKTAAEIKNFDIEKTFAKMGLDQHLSPNRRNGFFAMVERIKSFIVR